MKGIYDQYINFTKEALIGKLNQKPSLAVFIKEALIGTVFGKLVSYNPGTFV